MTKPFCMKCAEELLGPAAIEAARRNVATAPPASPEMKANVRAIFESARTFSADRSEGRTKRCGHGELMEGSN